MIEIRDSSLKFWNQKEIKIKSFKRNSESTHCSIFFEREPFQVIAIVSTLSAVQHLFCVCERKDIFANTSHRKLLKYFILY